AALPDQVGDQGQVDVAAADRGEKRLAGAIHPREHVEDVEAGGSRHAADATAQTAAGRPVAARSCSASCSSTSCEYRYCWSTVGCFAPSGSIGNQACGSEPGAPNSWR